LAHNSQSARTQAVPQVLTNADISEMLQTGLPPEIVAAKIKSSACNFDTSVATLNKLRADGVPAPVLLAMVEAPQSSPALADGKVRVFITDSQSWETYGSSYYHGSGSVNGGNGSFNQNGGSISGGGARPQTAEITKTFGERCPDLTVTNKAELASYVVTLDHEGGKGLLRHRNKIAVYNKQGDVIFSHSTITLGDSVQDACMAIHSNQGQSQQLSTQQGKNH
jgi:hypothetical protein